MQVSVLLTRFLNIILTKAFARLPPHAYQLTITSNSYVDVGFAPITPITSSTLREGFPHKEMCLWDFLTILSDRPEPAETSAVSAPIHPKDVLSG